MPRELSRQPPNDEADETHVGAVRNQAAPSVTRRSVPAVRRAARQVDRRPAMMVTMARGMHVPHVM